ncbi:phosphopantothenoylcysteine decarboxylase-like protein [Leptotrombidium deliense]|uniref:Phosphopantothenoylcysteine decarboxylase n=1 Tax=Leptotrombidium deliense TaxID=299467 RepID=A0A443SF05_9ACAR|nr:phosphopantothenoylcysteine decarboxylase-like protein [Leptotrombidium deliense]
MEKKFNVLIGVSGSVATVKLPMIIDKLKKLKSSRFDSLDIKVVATQHSFHFFDKNEIIKQNVTIYSDEDEWEQWKQMSDPVLHIELRKWAHLLVISPLDANTLGKVAHGLCDNLLTCVVRAWDFSKPLLFCPAMNTFMYSNPLTAESIEKLKSLGFHEIPVVSKKLACGDYGNGAMAEVETIVDSVKQKLEMIN